MVKKVFIINVYLPIQKSLKIELKISSTSTFPTIIPRCLVANLRSSAAISNSIISLELRYPSLNHFPFNSGVNINPGKF